MRRGFLQTLVMGCAAVLLATTAVAQNTAPPNKVFRFVPHTNLAVLDPIWTASLVTLNHAYGVYDTLYGVAQDLSPRPQMVAGHTVSSDGLVWEFTLRDGAKFSDGAPVTVEDVLWSFEKLGTDGSPRYATAWKKIAKAEKTGDRKVKFTFTELDREMPLILGLRPILEKAQWEGKDFTATTLEAPIGSGPYTVAEFEPGKFISFKKNPNWWGKDLPFNKGQWNFDEIRYDYYATDAAFGFDRLRAAARDRGQRGDGDGEGGGIGGDAAGTVGDDGGVNAGVGGSDRRERERGAGRAGEARAVLQPLIRQRRGAGGGDGGA